MRGAQQFTQSVIVLALAILQPAKAVEIRTVIRIQLECAADHLFRFIEVKIVLRPHIPDVVIGFGSVGRIEREGGAVTLLDVGRILDALGGPVEAGVEAS